MKSVCKSLVLAVAAAAAFSFVPGELQAQFVTPRPVVRTLPQRFPVSGNPYYYLNRNMAYYNPYNYVNPVAVNNFYNYSLPQFYNPYVYQAYSTPFAMPMYNPYMFPSYNPYLGPFGYGY